MSKALKICFDLRPLQIGHENRGIGMHIKSVLSNLPSDESYEYIFYHFEDNNPMENLNIVAGASYTSITTPRLATQVSGVSTIVDILKLTSHSFKELRGQNINTFVQFDFMLGIPKIKGMETVIIGYDLIPLIFKNVYMPNIPQALGHATGKKAKIRAALRSVYYQIRYKLSYSVFKRADKILSISDSTRQSFISLLGVSPDKVTTIPLAPVALSSGIDNSIIKAISDKPYIMYIGGTDFRKRIEDVVYIYNIVKGRGNNVSLVLAGNEFTDVETIPSVIGRSAIKNSPYRDDIHLMGFVTDQEKNALFQNAACFVFPSIYEGFGLPVLEAMLAPCPVVCYNNSSIPESSGGLATMVDSRDFTTAANSVISKLKMDKAEKSKSLEDGKLYAESLSWSAYVNTLINELS